MEKETRPEEKVTGILNEIEEKNREIMTLSEQMNDLVEQAGIRQRIKDIVIIWMKAEVSADEGRYFASNHGIMTGIIDGFLNRGMLTG